MAQYVAAWQRLKADPRAVTAVEYGLIAGLIVATVLVGFNVLAFDPQTKFSGVGGSLNANL